MDKQEHLENYHRYFSNMASAEDLSWQRFNRNTAWLTAGAMLADAILCVLSLNGYL